ncbi:MAG: hypothetical protein LCI00_17085 [Chloroflexi bacterium]|nr:hypothetical protein [Chloroflexota bacterium]
MKQLNRKGMGGSCEVSQAEQQPPANVLHTPKGDYICCGLPVHRNIDTALAFWREHGGDGSLQWPVRATPHGNTTPALGQLAG